MKICILLAALLSVAVAQTTVAPPATTLAAPVVKVVNTTADMISTNVNQMDTVIYRGQSNIDLFIVRYNEKVNVLDQNWNLIKDEIVRTNERLDLWATEGAYKKVCVQKYRHEISTSKEVQAAIQACVVAGRSYIAGLVRSANVYLNNAISRRTGFVAGARNCIRTQRGVTNQTLCITSQSDNWRGYFQGDILNLSNELESQLCLSNSYIKIAQQCVFTSIRSGFGTMNVASYKIQTCFEGKDQTVPCIHSNGLISLA